LRDLLSHAGFGHISVRVGARTPGDPFTVLIAAGTKAAKRSRRPGLLEHHGDPVS